MSKYDFYLQTCLHYLAKKILFCQSQVRSFFYFLEKLEKIIFTDKIKNKSEVRFSFNSLNFTQRTSNKPNESFSEQSRIKSETEKSPYLLQQQNPYQRNFFYTPT